VLGTYKVTGSAIALFVIVFVVLGLYPTRPVQAASLTATGGQGTITVTLNSVVNGESITICGTGGPSVCAGVPTPSGGGTGAFTSVSSPNCGLTIPPGTVNSLSFVSNCVAVTSITLTWQCLSSGPITFVLTSSVTASNQQTLSCGANGGGGSTGQVASGTGTICVAGNCVGVTANPNVVSCKGGSTTVTAFANYQFPQVIPSTPVQTQPTGLPMAQQPYFFFAVSEGIAQIQQTSNNTAVVTLLEGMPQATISATTGGITNTVKIFPYCRPGSAGASSASAAPVSGTPGAGGAPVVAGTPVAPPLPIGSLTITASPGTIETCDGSVFLSATVKDTNGKLVPDGTNVLFIATKGILDPASANTVLGTANVVYTSDLKAPGSIKLSAQSGAAFASVDIPVLCGVSGSLASGSAGGSFGTPTAGSPSFRPPNTGEAGSPSFRPPNTGQGPASIVIQPPNTGDAGLKTAPCSEIDEISQPVGGEAFEMASEVAS